MVLRPAADRTERSQQRAAERRERVVDPRRNDGVDPAFHEPVPLQRAQRLGESTYLSWRNQGETLPASGPSRPPVPRQESPMSEPFPRIHRFQASLFPVNAYLVELEAGVVLVDATLGVHDGRA